MKQPHMRALLTFFFLVLLLGVLFLLCVSAGSSSLTPLEALRSLTGGSGDRTGRRIIWMIRLPRVLAAMLLGGALSVSGFLLQTFFNNPIAGPFVLGISSGAKLLVAVTMIACLNMGTSYGSVTLILAAFVGAMCSMGFVLAAARQVRRMSMLIVCGIMIGYICSAVTDFLVTFAEDSNIVNLHNWSLGSFSGTTWENVRIMAVIVGITCLCTFFLSKPMSAYQLGENYARNMGVNLRLFRIELILLSSVLSACVTAFAGPISFVGIAVPHIVKRLLHSSRPLLVIPACFLGGAVFFMFCDLLARTLFAPTEVSISSVTAVFGAPVVLGMMIRKKGQEF